MFKFFGVFLLSCLVYVKQLIEAVFQAVFRCLEFFPFSSRFQEGLKLLLVIRFGEPQEGHLDQCQLRLNRIHVFSFQELFQTGDQLFPVQVIVITGGFRCCRFFFLRSGFLMMFL